MDGRIGLSMRRAGLLATATIALALAASPASATVRHVSPSSTDVAGTCEVTACRLDRALAVAQDNDEIVLAGGQYTIDFVARAARPLTIRPADGATRPVLLGAAGLTGPTLELAAGGTVRGLDIDAAAHTPLQLGGGARGIGMLLAAGPTAGPAARLVSSPARTALISSVAGAEKGNAVEIIDPTTGPGHASLVNVTAVSIGSSSWGVLTDMAAQRPVLTNVIARGTAKDLHGRSDTQPIAISSSNFRTGGFAANWGAVGPNQTDTPVAFVNEAGGDLRLAFGSAPIDQGVTDPLSSGTIDPDGNVRLFGLKPDIGAYEHGSSQPPAPATPQPPAATPGTGTEAGETTTAPAKPDATTGGGTDSATTTTTTPATTTQTTTTDATTPAADTDAEAGEDERRPEIVALPLPAVAPPVLAERVAIDVAEGTPLVRLPGATRFVPLTAAASVPVGSTVDATAGHVELTSVRDRRGATQTGTFWGGVFVVKQARNRAAFTDLVLTGGSFRGCPAAARRTAGPVARSAARKRKAKTVVRSLWGSDDKGRFRTRGRNSVATVRGTVWLVEDRCDGTRTTVKRGAVSVRPIVGGRPVLVKAGGSHLVRPPR